MIDIIKAIMTPIIDNKKLTIEATKIQTQIIDSYLCLKNTKKFKQSMINSYDNETLTELLIMIRKEIQTRAIKKLNNEI